MSNKIPFLYKYVLTAFTYGAARKLWYTRDMEYKIQINDKIETTPILYTHYMKFGVIHGIIGIYNFPFNIINDIEKIEMYVRNIKQLPNNDKNKTINYMDVMLDHHC